MITIQVNKEEFKRLSDTRRKMVSLDILVNASNHRHFFHDVYDDAADIERTIPYQSRIMAIVCNGQRVLRKCASVLIDSELNATYQYRDETFYERVLTYCFGETVDAGQI